MRRVVSISVLFGLFASMASPVLMAAKMQSDDCPLLKLKGHRCDQMMAQMAHRTSGSQGSSSGSATFSTESSAGKCPVECLMLNSAKHSVTASSLALSPAFVTSANRPVSLLSFISVGRSQHTDRGPPLFELPA
jgi:hypothetical protein